MIAPLRRAGRALLQLWGAAGRAPGLRYQVVERWGAALAEPQPLPCRLPGGLMLHCDLRELVDRIVYFNGLAEPVESWLLLKLLKPGMVVVDAGANIGQYTLLAARAVGPSGSVLAFEPVPFNFTRLIRHVSENRLANVSLYEEALWDSATTLELAQPEGYEDNTGTFSTGVHGATRYESVPALPFDEVASRMQLARVDVVKMDIEGGEYRALLGMQRTIDRDHPLLLVELNRVTLERAGSSLDQLWELLTVRFGYRAWRIGSTPEYGGLLHNINAVQQDNALFFTGDVPAVLRERWSLPDVLRWARAG